MSINAKPPLIGAAVFLLCLLVVGAAEVVSYSVRRGGASDSPRVDEFDRAGASAVIDVVDDALARRSAPSSTAVSQTGVEGVAGNGEAVVVQPGVESWWSSLPRHRRGWWIATAISDPEALVSAASYVRCEDLNPRDVPLSWSQFRHIADIADPLGEEVRRLWKDRLEMMHVEMLDRVESGQLTERRGDNLTGPQREIYAAELRFFKQRLKDSTEVSSAERLAIVNALGRATGGFVHTTRDGRTFSASPGELPRTQQLDQAARMRKGDIALWVIGTMGEFGVLEPQESLRLVDLTWKRLKLQ